MSTFVLLADEVQIEEELLQDQKKNFKEAIHKNPNIQLLYSCSDSSEPPSLLPLHSKSFEISHTNELECYYLPLENQIISTTEAKQFWTEAHYYSALRHSMLCSTPYQTKQDFLWKYNANDENKYSTICTVSSSSNSINEVFGLIMQQQQMKKKAKPNEEFDELKMDESVLLIEAHSDSNFSAASCASFSFANAFSFLSNQANENDDVEMVLKQDRLNEASRRIGKLASQNFFSLIERNEKTDSKANKINSPNRKNKPSSAYQVITGTPKKIASALTNGLVGGMTSLLVSFDILDDPEYQDAVKDQSYDQVPNGMDDSFSAAANKATIEFIDKQRDLQEKEQQLIVSKRVLPVHDEDIILNLQLAVDCSILIIQFVCFMKRNTTGIIEQGNPDFFVSQDKIIIHRYNYNNDGPSWPKFCKYVGRHFLSNQIFTTNDWKIQAQVHLLSNISPKDADFLASALRSISIIHSNEDESIFFIDISNTSLSFTNQAELSKVDQALFELTCTQKTLLVRIQTLTNEIDQIKKQAIQQYKNKMTSSQTKSIIRLLQKRKLREEQLDRYNDTLLNIETSLECLYRTLSDIETTKALEISRKSMKALRLETTNSSFCEEATFTLDYIDDIMEDWKEEMESSQMLTDVLCQDIVQDGSNRGFDMKELEKELENLNLDLTENHTVGEIGSPKTNFDRNSRQDDDLRVRKVLKKNVAIEEKTIECQKKSEETKSKANMILS